jgi:hypothetical protein
MEPAYLYVVIDIVGYPNSYPFSLMLMVSDSVAEPSAEYERHIAVLNFSNGRLDMCRNPKGEDFVQGPFILANFARDIAPIIYSNFKVQENVKEKQLP